MRMYIYAFIYTYIYMLHINTAKMSRKHLNMYISAQRELIRCSSLWKPINFLDSQVILFSLFFFYFKPLPQRSGDTFKGGPKPLENEINKELVFET